MKYFLDTEFIEGTQKSIFNTKPTIDLISIGIVCEDGREYYAISKDFNLKEAWNRFQIDNEAYKKYWLRDNVLKPIFIELRAKEVEEYNIAKRRNVILNFPTYSFCFKEFKRLLNKYGKSNKQIAEEIKDFIIHKDNIIIWEDIYDKTKQNKSIDGKSNWTYEERIEQLQYKYPKFVPQFYGYYADYDWVVFCWLFGKMIDLPKGFPMYCIDLKQTLDDCADIYYDLKENILVINTSFETKLNAIKEHPNYPKQTNEHNALADARWNYELYKFLNNGNN